MNSLYLLCLVASLCLSSCAAHTQKGYTGSLSLLTTLGASTSSQCDSNYASACSISSASMINVAVVSAMKEAQTVAQLQGVFSAIAAGRYDSPRLTVGSSFQPEVWAFNGTKVSSVEHRQGPSATTTWPAYFGSETWSLLLKTANDTTRTGVVEFEATRRHGDHFVAMIQGVTGSDGHDYVVLTKYKAALASQVPCDRAYGAACATFNAVALAGKMVSAVLASSNRTATYAEISQQNTKFHVQSTSEKNFYGWIYTAQGVAVAHGNGGLGRVLSNFLLQTRLSTANRGGGFVDYSMQTTGRRADSYGSTHGSYVLPIYDNNGAVTHFAGVSFSVVAPPAPVSSDSKCRELTATAILLLCLCLVLSIGVCYCCFKSGLMKAGGSESEQGADGEGKQTQTLMRNCYTRAPPEC